MHADRKKLFLRIYMKLSMIKMIIVIFLCFHVEVELTQEKVQNMVLMNNLGYFLIQ